MDVVMFAATGPFQARQLLLNGASLNIIGVEDAPDLLFVSELDALIPVLENESEDFVLISMPLDSSSKKILRQTIEDHFSGERRRIQLRRTVPFYTDICAVTRGEIENAIVYSKDNFAGFAWSMKEHCPLSQRRFVAHYVEGVFRPEKGRL